jgi:hypothetical protein
MSEIDVVKAFQAAQVDPSEATLASLRPHLSEGIEFSGFAGRTALGATATLEALKDPQVADLLRPAQWSEPSVDGSVASVTAKLAPGALIGGANITLRFHDGKVASATYEMLPAAPAPATELVMTDAIKEAVNTALLSGNPMMIAYVRPDGYPSLSFRGSTQTWSDTALAVWVRNPDGGLLAALPHNEHVTFWYRRSDPVTMYQFWGRARVQNDEETRELVYSHAPEPEQRLDQQRRGIPIIIELDRIEGRVGRDPIRMVRSAQN